jgi:hypothetical protein
MAFSEIKVSPKVYTIVKIVILVAVFLVVAINVIAHSASAYEFVYCENGNGLTITYPTGTVCHDNSSDDESEDDEDEDDKK